MSNAEQGISQAQTEAVRGQLVEKDGLRSAMSTNIVYQNERIIVYSLAFCMLGLLVVWATASSPLLLHGSLALVILLTLLWGLARIAGIERKRAERAQQAAEFESANQRFE
ncbi:MAG TPA: hypothetical protein VIW27_04375 [Gammaproteobacteria bacterium]|jgi:hypothetical protein